MIDRMQSINEDAGRGAATASLPEMIRTVEDLERLGRAAQRHEVPCGDGTMVWHRWGLGSEGAPPVVLLHGGSGSWTHWARNITALVESGRQVWIPDLPGFGESARPPEGDDADAMPEPLKAALESLLGETVIDLVGFSFGSMAAAFIAAETPARVRRLVLSGAPALGIKPDEPFVLRPWRHLEGDKLMAAHRINLGRLMLSRPESIDAVALAIHSTNLPRDRMKTRRLSRTDILLRTLPRIRCPIYGIWGDRDVLYRGVIERVEPALAQAPDFRWLERVAGSGHWVQFECPEEFNRALARALG
jgi:2-hydroxy-6-oxonona-2,4-dienedioate hydrolase